MNQEEGQDRMQEDILKKGQSPQSAASKPKQSPPKKDYIDFEEIR